ncbi:hypothetical protein BBJ28_00024709, partial [Nothophytophthora sp. Chile5]
MRVEGNEPQRVDADGVDSSVVAVTEPVVPAEVGEGAVPNQVVSRQDGDHVHISAIRDDPDDEEEGKQEEDDPQDVQLQPQRLFDMTENQRPDEEETPAQDSARSELEREAELAQQRVSRANRRQRGVYTYRVQGAMGHFMGSLLPYNDRATGEMTAPKFAQIYIVDADMRRRAERRRGVFADLDPSILFDLEQMMERHNPFAQDFLYFGKVLRRQREAGQQPVDIVFKLHANNRASPGTYNLPTTSEVAAVMIDDGNIGHHRDLLLYTRDHTPTRLFETHAIYDPLQYPLLFPCGELGWTYTDTYANGAIVRNKRELPLREHVAYRLHPKHGDGSVLHEGGRLFQQYAVDQRAKCEQNNLRWIAANQKDIRADVYTGIQDAYLNESVI